MSQAKVRQFLTNFRQFLAIFRKFSPKFGKKIGNIWPKILAYPPDELYVPHCNMFAKILYKFPKKIKTKMESTSSENSYFYKVS